jgi:hypothetical protein
MEITESRSIINFTKSTSWLRIAMTVIIIVIGVLGYANQSFLFFDAKRDGLFIFAVLVSIPLGITYLLYLLWGEYVNPKVIKIDFENKVIALSEQNHIDFDKIKSVLFVEMNGRFSVDVFMKTENSLSTPMIYTCSVRSEQLVSRAADIDIFKPPIYREPFLL